MAAKKKSKAMSIAFSPGKQIGMSAFMMYMSGQNLNIFSINTVSMAILTPIGNILNMDRVFAALSDVDLQMPKLAYFAMNMAWLAVGLYKMSSMRLLPTTAADWTSKIQWKEALEGSSLPSDNMLF